MTTKITKSKARYLLQGSARELPEWIQYANETLCTFANDLEAALEHPAKDLGLTENQCEAMADIQSRLTRMVGECVQMRRTLVPISKRLAKEP